MTMILEADGHIATLSEVRSRMASTMHFANRIQITGLKYSEPASLDPTPQDVKTLEDIRRWLRFFYLEGHDKVDCLGRDQLDDLYKGLGDLIHRLRKSPDSGL